MQAAEPAVHAVQCLRLPQRSPLSLLRQRSGGTDGTMCDEHLQVNTRCLIIDHTKGRGLHACSPSCPYFAQLHSYRFFCCLCTSCILISACQTEKLLACIAKTAVLYKHTVPPHPMIQHFMVLQVFKDTHQSSCLLSSRYTMQSCIAC